MRTLGWLIVTTTALALTGCGDSYGGLSQADYEKAKAALEKALNAWKNGEPAKKWTTPNAPIRFVDDIWVQGYSLVDYQITSIRRNIDGYPEAVVTLTLKRKGGGQGVKETLYGINIKEPNQVTIGSDPMY